MQGIAAYANQEFMPPGAIADIRGAAEMLERFGREGDVYVVHAAEGETVVPMEVLNSSPNLKKMLFTQMEEMGLSPERYIVGNELNSLNPVTGRPEFFFKNLWKSVRSIFKIAAPILGTIAMTMLLGPGGLGLSAAMTAAMGATATGAITAAAGAGIGSFVAQKLTGSSTKDALRMSAFAAGSAGIIGGFNSAFPAFGETIGGWGDSITESLTGGIGDSTIGGIGDAALGDAVAGIDFSAPNPLGQTAQLGIVDSSPFTPALAARASDPLRTSNMFMTKQTPGPVRFSPKLDEMGIGGFSASDVARDPTGPWYGSEVGPVAELQAMGYNQVPYGTPAPLAAVQSEPTQMFVDGTPVLSGGRKSGLAAMELSQPPLDPGLTLNQLDMRDNVGNFEDYGDFEPVISGGGGQGLLQGGHRSDNFAMQEALNPAGRNAKIPRVSQGALNSPPLTPTQVRLQMEGMNTAYSDWPSPSQTVLQKLATGITGLPEAAYTTVMANKFPALLGAGGFGMSAWETHQANKKIEEDERKRLAGNLALYNYYTNRNAMGGRGDLVAAPVRPSVERRRALLAEHGGAIPGQGQGDIVPAMLEPGEFVMTRNAVTGAGGGSQKDGIKRMYSMMRELEGRV